MTDEEQAGIIVVSVKPCFVCETPATHVVAVLLGDNLHDKSACDAHRTQIEAEAHEMLKAFGLEPENPVDTEPTDPNPTLN